MKKAHYSTLLNVELRAALGRLEGNERPVVLLDDQAFRVDTALDLACILGTFALGKGPSTVTRQLAGELVAGQAAEVGGNAAVAVITHGMGGVIM